MHLVEVPEPSGISPFILISISITLCSRLS